MKYFESYPIVVSASVLQGSSFQMGDHEIWNLIEAIKWEKAYPSDDTFLDMLNEELNLSLKNLEN